MITDIAIVINIENIRFNAQKIQVTKSQDNKIVVTEKTRPSIAPV